MAVTPRTRRTQSAQSGNERQGVVALQRNQFLTSHASPTNLLQLCGLCLLRVRGVTERKLTGG
jgi:hypothetical protein